MKEENQQETTETTETNIVPDTTTTPTQPTESAETNSTEEAPSVTEPVEAEVTETIAEAVTEAEEVAAAETDSSTATAAAPLALPARKLRFTPVQMVLGFLVVLAILIGLIYLLERQGTLTTGIFDGIEQARQERTVVATVDGQSISEFDLQVSMNQQLTAARAQGVDTSSAAVSDNIRMQSLDLLINTALLKNEALERGLTVTDEQAAQRYDSLVTQIGSEEELRNRMETFGVTEEILQRDIRDELLIQQLVDQLFSEQEVAVTPEEARAFYEEAGGEAAGLPPFADVEAQVVDQIRITKEQEVVNGFIEALRAEATIETTL